MSFQLLPLEIRDVEDLRRWYAGQAMQAMLGNCVQTSKDNVSSPRTLRHTERQLLAAQSYLIAEEMILVEHLQGQELEDFISDLYPKG